MRFHDPEYARNYENKLSSEGYPGLLLKRIIPLLQGPSILEIGCGSGFFTIPLLDYGYQVSALDPSKAMLKILTLKTKTNHNCTIINDSWEKTKIGEHDTILCAHALYPMEDIEKAILKMTSVSNNTIIVIRNDSGNKNLSELIMNYFNQSKPKNYYNRKLQSILKDNRLFFNVIEVTEKRKIILNDIKKEALYYYKHLRIQNPEEIEKALKKITKYNIEKDIYFFNALYRDNIYHIKK